MRILQIFFTPVTIFIRKVCPDKIPIAKKYNALAS